MSRDPKAPRCFSRWLIMVWYAPLRVVGVRTAYAQPDTTGGRPECPNHDVAIRVTGREQGTSIVLRSLAVSGPITKVPEFHDCQRLLNASDTKYGPLVAIFASFRMDSIYRSPKQTRELPAFAAAEIYSYDGDYAPLGIKKGFNCLYMRGDPVSHLWKASIQPVPNDTNCLKPPTGPGIPLTARLSDAEDFQESDIPPVARWERASNGLYYIGIKCGDRWCNVGRAVKVGGVSSFTPAAALAADPSWSKKARRVRRVKGYYDEQRLSYPVAASSLPRPGNSHGWVVPFPDIESYTETMFRASYMPVATVILDKPDSVYKRKLNLEKGSNQLSLHEDSLGAWSAMIVSAGGEIQYFKVTRRSHSAIKALMPSFRVPGATRWRWHPDDETIWSPCLIGCCEVQSGGTTNLTSLGGPTLQVGAR